MPRSSDNLPEMSLTISDEPSKSKSGSMGDEANLLTKDQL